MTFLSDLLSLKLNLPKSTTLVDIQAGNTVYTFSDFSQELLEAITLQIDDAERVIPLFSAVYVVCQAVSIKGEEEGIRVLSKMTNTVFFEAGMNLLMDIAGVLESTIDLFTTIMLQQFQAFREQGHTAEESAELLNAEIRRNLGVPEDRA